jgi:hypothetical protein
LNCIKVQDFIERKIQMGITDDTRQSAYEEVLETLGSRQSDVYNELSKLGDVGATANELAQLMWKKGYFVTPERNRVHPRLNELAKEEFVLVKDKRECRISKRNCAVYVVNPKKERN